MKLDDGTIITGIFQYKDKIIYTPNDLLIIVTDTNFRLVRVTTQFLSSGVAEDDSINYGYYDQITNSNDDLMNTTKLIRSADLMVYLLGLSKLHKSGKVLNLVQTGLLVVTIPGIYKLVPDLSDLPPLYIPTECSTLRVSEFSSGVIVQEILDVLSSKYYVRAFNAPAGVFTGMIKDWVNLNQSDNMDAITQANIAINESSLHTQELERIIDTIIETHRYDIAVPNVDYITTAVTDGGEITLLSEGDFRIMVISADYKLSLSVNTTDPIGTKYSRVVPVYCLRRNSSTSITIKFSSSIRISTILKLR